MWPVLGVLLLLLAVALLAATPARAATEPVKVALSDKQPADVTITAGDSVVFVNGEPAPLGASHQVTSATAPGAGTWSYDSGALAPGAQSAPVAFPQAGTFVYTDTRRVGVVPAASFTAKVVVQPAPAAPAPAAGPPTSSPATRSTARPAPPRTTAPAAGLPQNRPSAGPPPAGQAAALPTAAVPAGAVPPAVAPLFGAAALPQTEPTVTATLPPVQAVSGPLPGATASRGFGLAAALAAVAVGGVVSLLVRVLLSDPAAHRPVLPVTVEHPAR